MKNNTIQINVNVTYLEEQSNTSNKQFVFAYVITISNFGKTNVQLLTRHWYITDETGHVEEVIGEGVIGQQPYIQSGQAFQYESGAVIKTATGTMKGSYGMINDNGKMFEVTIPEFVLSKSYTLH